MGEFRISTMRYSSALYTYDIRDSIQINPSYQRMSDVWPLDKRQLLIDSIFNQFDIPKIYLHEFWPALEKGGKTYKYAIIDGKQRLESIWKFIDGEFPLNDDFKYLHDSNIKAGGLTYGDLGKKYPSLKVKFDASELSIITIQTKEIELIEEMFSRLNEAVPLNAPEKRNAYGGAITLLIREIIKHNFFNNNIPFKNKRYVFHDLAAKFLYIQFNKDKGPKKFYDTKKIYLDEFVKKNKNLNESSLKELRSETKEILLRMSQIFTKPDDLLKSTGMIVVYFLLFRDALQDLWIEEISRDKFIKFEELRRKNRIIAEKNISKASFHLLEFDRYVQSPNDGAAIDFKVGILKDFLLGVDLFKK